jgi:hypothetical protein
VPRTLETCIAAGTPLKSEWLRGSMQPFAGWQMVGHSPTPTNALLVTQATGSWFVNSFRLLNEGAQRSSTPATVSWQGPERWTVELENGEKVSRDGDAIHWTSLRQAGDSLTLTPPAADVPGRIRAIRSNYFAALRQYPKFEDSFAARRKLTLLLLVGLFASMAALVVVRRVWAKVYPHAVVFAAILWIVGAFTLVLRFKTIF